MEAYETFLKKPYTVVAYNTVSKFRKYLSYWSS